MATLRLADRLPLNDAGSSRGRGWPRCVVVQDTALGRQHGRRARPAPLGAVGAGCNGHPIGPTFENESHMKAGCWAGFSVVAGVLATGGCSFWIGLNDPPDGRGSRLAWAGRFRA